MNANPLQPVVERIVAGGGPTAPPAGAAIGLRVGDVESAAAAGVRAVDPEAAMTTDTVHDLASVTKIVATTTSLIRLASQDQLQLDDPVTRYLSWFSGDGRETVTVRHLLAHRSGLWEWQPMYLTGDDPWRYLARLPLRYRPDSGRHYSDLGFMLLGRLIEIITGERLDQAVRQLVTEPMGLTGITYAPPVNAEVAASAYGDAAERRMVATGEPYPILQPGPSHDWRSLPIVGEVNDGNAHHVFDGVSGHAGLFGGLRDLLRFAHTLARYRDHTQLWRPHIVEQFLAAGPDTGQRLGFRSWSPSEPGGQTIYGHPGFVGCTVGFIPQADTAIVLCTNRLLTHRTPTPNEELWAQARAALSDLNLYRLTGREESP